MMKMSDKPGQQRKSGLTYEQIRKTAMIYMALPLFCFFCGYLRWYFMLLCVGTLAVVTCFAWKGSGKETAGIIDADRQMPGLSWKTILLVFGVSLIWTYLGGMNGYFFQSWDWAWRNAVYFDLIEYNWPVIYPETGSALVYYFGHWLPPAALAKGVTLLTGSLEAGMTAGRFLLWLWSCVGLTIIMLMLFHLLRVITCKGRVFAVLLFVFFSGMDVVGAVGLGNIGDLLNPAVTNWQQFHLERWCHGYEFSSVTTCVFWVFNQAIIPWMITLCFLEEEHPRNYVFYGTVCLLCGTLPCVGLAILMIAKAIVYCIRGTKAKKIKSSLAAVFSLQNILAFVILFPVIAAFILSCNTARYVKGNSYIQYNPVIAVAYAEEETAADNNASEVDGEEGEAETPEAVKSINQVTTEKKSILKDIFSGNYLNIKLFTFLFLEVGCFMILIWCDYKKDYLFYVIGLGFLFIPYFHIGESNDFCMRVTIPGLLILMVYAGKYLLKNFPTRLNREQHTAKCGRIRQATAVMLAICLMVGSATPIVEMFRGVYNVATKGTILLEDRRVMTFKERVPDNFACSNPSEHFFFDYLAR